MDLDTWLMRNEMETNEIARIIGVSRQVIWKVKSGQSVDTITSEKIYFVTGGCVKPPCNPRGRPRLEKNKGL